MKNKLLKKLGILSLTLVVSLVATSHAWAKEVCTTYDNYYFFNEIEWSEDMDKIFKGEIEAEYYKDGILNRYYATYFPTISKEAKAPKGNENIISRRVCLSKNDKADGTVGVCGNGNTWTLKDFYNKENWVASSTPEAPTEKTLDIGNGKTTSYHYKSEETKDEDGEKVITTYYKHGTWFRTNSEGVIGDAHGEGVNYIKEYGNNIDVLIKGSYLPTTTSITFDPTKNSLAKVMREIKTADREGITPFEATWPSGKHKSELMPALYQVKYRLCETVEDKYNATIKYFVKNSDGTVTEITKENKLKFDDGKTSPWTKDNLDDGYSEKVESPKLEGCKADKAAIDVKIEGADFEDEVYYTCEVKENQKTGSLLIFTAWAIGIGALGYSAYYFSKMKKAKENEPKE